MRPEKTKAARRDPAAFETAVQRRADHTAPEAPEHSGSRRRFLIWSLMLGAVPPERVTERIVAEIEGER